MPRFPPRQAHHRADRADQDQELGQRQRVPRRLRTLAERERARETLSRALARPAEGAIARAAVGAVSDAERLRSGSEPAARRLQPAAACGARPLGTPLARANATALVAIGHGVSAVAEVRCAASTSMLPPILVSMSTSASSAEPAGAGIPDSALPGPFPVGEYAAALRSKLRSLARVQLVGELVNLRPSRARVYFELRDATGAIPCAAWLKDWEAMIARAGGAPAEGMQIVVAGRLRLLPRKRHLLAGVLLRGRRPARRRRGGPAGPHRPPAQAARRARGCSSSRSGSSARCFPARSA